MIAFEVGRFGRFKQTVFLPTKLLIGQHRLANVNTPVVNQTGFGNGETIGGQNAADRVAQKIIAQVAQMEWLVGVWRRKFDHHRLPVRPCYAEIRFGHNRVQCVHVGGVRQADVEKTLHHVEAADNRCVGL